MGKTPSRDNPEYWSRPEFPWISIADLSCAGKYIYETKESLSKRAIEESGIKIIPEQTVIMSFKLSIGKVSITPWPMYSNEAIMAFIDKGIIQIKPEYLYYLLLHKNWDEGTNKAVMGKTLNKATLSEVTIDVHPIEEQDKIIAILDKVNEMVENYKRQILTFDTLIKARFVEMFGNETNPKEWPVVNVEEIADVSVGVVIKPASYYTDSEHGVKAFRSLNIGEMTIKDNEWVYFSEEGNKKNEKSILSENDILVVRSGAPGTACVVTKEYSGCNAIDIIIARPNTRKINPYYLCMYTNMLHGKRQIIEGTGGAAQQHFNVGKYNKLRLFLPPKEKQEQFADFVFKIDKSKSIVQKSLNETELLFHSLMQKYFG